jgi:hypothetical protein
MILEYINNDSDNFHLFFLNNEAYGYNSYKHDNSFMEFILTYSYMINYMIKVPRIMNSNSLYTAIINNMVMLKFNRYLVVCYKTE